jgi:hypothetical protein
MNKKKKLLLDKDIKATIRLLRYLTKGEGYASISLFDAGVGGGFNDGMVQVFLERDGVLFNKDGKINAHTPQELFDQIKFASDPNKIREESFTIKQRNKWYKQRKWDEK